MNRAESRVFMSRYIYNRVQELSALVFLNECNRMDMYQRSYRLARGFPEEPPEPRRKFDYGTLSEMWTVEIHAQKTEPLKMRELQS